MKKIITIFIAVLVLSCSKDDNGSLPVTFQNLAGQWKIKSIIRTNGISVPYVGLCPTKTDYLEIFEYRKIITYNYYQNCINTQDWGTSAFTTTSSNLIHTGGPIFDEGTVSELTSSGFKLTYANPKALDFMINNVIDAKTVIFEKY